MRSTKSLPIWLAATLLLTANAGGAIISVSATGTVVFNAIGDAPLSNVSSGDSVEISFTVDSAVFVDSIPGDVRAYEIDQSSFSITFSTPLEMGLLNPYPGGDVPYFGVIDGFPVADGFFVSDSPLSPGGVDLEQTPFNANLDLGYDGSTLSSTDILDALGTYDFTGLTRFGFNLWSIVPDNVAMEIDFQQMTISEQAIPEPGSIIVLGSFSTMALLRRRRIMVTD